MNRIILFSILLALLLFTVAAYSVSMSIDQVAQLGGTGEVSVSCPANPCSITSVKWGLSGSPPRVSSATISWTPASSTGSYTVYVVLYGNGTVISSGSETQQGSSSSVTTTVSLSSPANPKDVTRVEIIIVQN